MNIAEAFDRPTFILSTPRAGSSLLFQTMAQASSTFTIGGESHALIETIPGLHPRGQGWSSNALSAVDATPPIASEIARRFYARLRDRQGRPAAGRVRMIEKTPKNSLRVPFIEAVFPDALYVYLYRDPRETISSMIEAWHSGGFVTYPRLPGWSGIPWSLLLVPGWRDLAGRSLAEIVATQWATTTTILLDDLAAVPSDRVITLSYAQLLASPQSTVAALCGTLDLPWDRNLEADLPLSPTVVSPPRPDKWRRDQAAIAGVWPILHDADVRARTLLGASS
jgi:hypothetical protein